MKTTIITITHTNNADLSSVLGKVMNDICAKYTKSSGELPSLTYATPQPAYLPGIAPQPIQQNIDDGLMSSYNFTTTDEVAK